MTVPFPLFSSLLAHGGETNPDGDPIRQIPETPVVATERVLLGNDTRRGRCSRTARSRDRGRPSAQFFCWSTGRVIHKESKVSMKCFETSSTFFTFSIFLASPYPRNLRRVWKSSRNSLTLIAHVLVLVQHVHYLPRRLAPLSNLGFVPVPDARRKLQAISFKFWN